MRNYFLIFIVVDLILVYLFADFGTETIEDFRTSYKEKSKSNKNNTIILESKLKNIYGIQIEDMVTCNGTLGDISLDKDKYSIKNECQSEDYCYLEISDNNSIGFPEVININQKDEFGECYINELYSENYSMIVESKATIEIPVEIYSKVNFQDEDNDFESENGDYIGYQTVLMNDRNAFLINISYIDYVDEDNFYLNEEILFKIKYKE